MEGIAPTSVGGDVVLLSFALGCSLSPWELLGIDFLPAGVLQPEEGLVLLVDWV